MTVVVARANREAVLTLLQQLVSVATAFAGDVQRELLGAAKQPQPPTRAAAELRAITQHIAELTEPASADPLRELAALQPEFAVLRTTTLSGTGLRLLIAELAARARSLKERCPSAAHDADILIRELTAIARARNVGHVLGLRRNDRGDWKQIASSLRAQRVLMVGREPITHRMSLPSVGPDGSLEPSAVASPRSLEAGHERAERSFRIDVLLRHGPLVLVGGRVKTKKRDLIEERWGLQVEWIATNDNTKSVQVLRDRIAQGTIGAVIILERLISHSQYAVLQDAVRKAGTPVAYAATAGVGAIRLALIQLEDRLAQR